MLKKPQALCALLLACGLALALQGCGGGDGGSGSSSTSTGTGTGTTTSTSTGGTSPIVTTGANVVAMTVDAGPNPNAPNVPFVSVTVCAPGSTTACDTIDHVMVDTGSTGLRVLSSSLVNSLATMPQNIDSTSGNGVAECGAFVSGYTWGTVRTADVAIGQEKAPNQNLQVIADPAAGSAPSGCTSAGSSTEISTATALGANGVLGVQGFLQDCGSGCATATTPVAGAYYACNATTCSAINVPLGLQVGNTAASFTTDNNGVILQMPSVGATGATSVSGSLVFGIGTQSNNGLKQAVQIPTDDNFAFLATYKGSAISNSFVDSGSNFLFFSDSTIPACTQTGLASFYCPTSTLSETATLTASSTGSSSGSSSSSTTSYPAAFSIANAATVLAATSNYAFSNVGANVGSSQGLGMDFGMPFFYGKNVYIGFEGALSSTSTTGTAGFVAFSSTGQ